MARHSFNILTLIWLQFLILLFLNLLYVFSKHGSPSPFCLFFPYLQFFAFLFPTSKIVICTLIYTPPKTLASRWVLKFFYWRGTGGVCSWDLVSEQCEPVVTWEVDCRVVSCMVFAHTLKYMNAYLWVYRLQNMKKLSSHKWKVFTPKHYLVMLYTLENYTIWKNIHRFVW